MNVATIVGNIAPECSWEGAAGSISKIAGDSGTPTAGNTMQA